MTEQKKPRKRKVSQTESGEAPLESKESKGINMDAISQELAELDTRRQDLAKKLR